MRKTLKLISIACLVWSLSLMIFGVFFDVEINSGPPLVVKSGSQFMKLRMGDFKADLFDYATTDYSFCSTTGFKNTGYGFAFYQVIGSETSDMGAIRVPKLHITTVYPAFFVIAIFVCAIGFLVNPVRFRSN